MKLQLVSKQPVPIDLDEVKAHLRLLTGDEDELLRIYIDAVIDKAEQITGRALSRRTYALYTEKAKEVELPYPPFRSIVSVEIDRGSGYEACEYELDDKGVVAVVRFGEVCSETNCQKVVFECGYDEIPAAIKSWIFVNIANLYENRTSINVESYKRMPRTFVDHLLDSYRVRQI